jgi:sec-independent protein translocase protein TatA
MGLFDSPSHLLILLVVLVVLFGAARLPKAAKSMGEAMRIFKKETQKLHDDDPQPSAQVQASAAPQVAPPTPAPIQQAAQQPAAAHEQMAALKQQMDALQQQIASQPPAQGSNPAAPPTQATNQPG